MHEKFLITLYLPFCRVNFHIKWGSALRICIRLPICLFILSTMIKRKVLSPLKPSPKNSFWLATFVIYYKNLQIHLFFTLSLGLLSPLNLSFSDIHKVRKFLLSLSMKCWNLVWNVKSQHSSSTGRRSENIVVEVLRIKEVKGETQKIVEIDGF